MVGLAARIEPNILERRARLTIWASWTFLAFSVAAAISEIFEATGIVNLNSGVPDTVSLFAGITYVVRFLVLMVSVVLFCRWIYRANANLHESGLEGLEFTPGWTVGWYFVPVASLFKPFQAMRELWNASHGKSPPYNSVTPPEVSRWWACWITGGILENIGGRIQSDSSGGAIMNAIGAVLMVIAAKALIDLVQEITRAQEDSVSLAETFS